ncbi:MAG: hypothetical protein ACPG6P_11845, partial [Akkermansiaceae bacterium]
SALFIAFGVILQAQNEDLKNEKPKDEKPQVPLLPQDTQTLIANLGNESFAIRQAAYTKLWKIGHPAIPLLKKATQNTDPEISFRAKELTLFISSGIIPNTPAHIRKLVIAYTQGDRTVKISVIKKLIELEQWKQVLHLANSEKDPSTKKLYANDLRAATLGAVRSAVREGKLNEANNLLELCENDTYILSIRAWLHHCQGTTDEALAKAKNLPGKEAAQWRMALHRASGNLTGAIREAKRAGMADTAASLAILQGDPIPWIKHSADKKHLDVLYQTAIKLQLARLNGENKKAALLTRELAGMRRNRDTTERAIYAIAANGFCKEAIALLKDHNQDQLSDYYDSIERPTLALEALGIPSDAAAPYTSWVEKNTALAIKNEDKTLHSRIISLASFLQQHGETDHANTIITHYMQELRKKDLDLWHDQIRLIAAYDLNLPAIEFIKQLGNKNQEMDHAIKSLFGDSNATIHLWDALKQRNKTDINAALHQISLLGGLLPDTEKTCEPLHQALLLEIKNNLAVNKTRRLESLYFFARLRCNLRETARLSILVANNDPEKNNEPIFFNGAIGNWKAIKHLVQEAGSKKDSSITNMIQWYICQLQTGDTEAAEATYNHIMKLSLGGPRTLIALARALDAAGLNTKAAKVWIQVATLIEPNDRFHPFVIDSLTQHDQQLYAAKQWKLASALAEVKTLIYAGGQGSSTIKNQLDNFFLGEFSRGMALLEKGDRSAAIKKFQTCVDTVPLGDDFADTFFPTLRTKNMEKHYNRWFQTMYQTAEKASKRYPKCHNTHNTAAWLASRSVRNLDKALEHAKQALALRPAQAAYIDTMAEVWFAKGDRAKSIEWSKIAVDAALTKRQGFLRSDANNIASYQSLLGQLQRFEKEELPK